MIKTDTDGNLVWSKTFGGSGIEIGYSIVQSADGGYAIGGLSDSYGAGSQDIYLLKTNEDGVLEWSKTFGGNGLDQGLAVVEDGDGGFTVSGSVGSYGAGGLDVLLLKVDVLGNFLWSKAYGGTNNDYTFSLIHTIDGGYLTVGGTHSWEVSGAPGTAAIDRQYIIKTNSQGSSGCYETDFTPQISSGGIEGSGGVEGAGVLVNNGGTQNGWFPDTLTLCFEQISCTQMTSNLIQQNNACFNECSGSISVESLTGNAPFSYLWSPAIAGSNDSLASGLCTGNYFVTVIDAGGCDSLFTFAITEPALIGTNENQTICNGDSIYVGGNWQVGVGLYFDMLSAANGCDSIVETAVNVAFAQTSAVDVSICIGDSLYIGGDYQNTAGLYTDIIRGIVGCDSIITETNLVVVEMPQPAISGLDSICSGGKATLTLDGNFDSQIWSTGQDLNKISVSPDISSIYTVTTFDSCGISQAEHNLYVDPCYEPSIYLPNVFSPNGSGSNDLLKVEGNGILQLHLVIYSRWGEIVFKTDAIERGWDGKFNGIAMKSQVFAYHLQAEFVTGETIMDSGTITLVQ